MIVKINGLDARFNICPTGNKSCVNCLQSMMLGSNRYCVMKKTSQLINFEIDCLISLVNIDNIEMNI